MDQAPLAEVVPRVLAELVRELRPGEAPAVRPQSRLDRDLGLDSLSRVELLSRLEAALGRPFPEAAMARAETVADLIAAAEDPDAWSASVETGNGPARNGTGDQRGGSGSRGAAAGTPDPAAEPDGPGPLAPPPGDAETIIDVLRYWAEAGGDRTHLTLYDDDGATTEHSCRDLLAGAEAVARGLVAEGVDPGQAVSIMLPTSRDFFDAFFGILMAGAVPVPMYPPVRPSQVEEHMRRQAVILETARVPVMITVPEARHLGRFLMAKVGPLRRLATTAELAVEGRPGGALPALRGEQTAFLQFTSGSTGNPKGVVLSHANLLANIRAIVVAAAPVAGDRFVSWLPLYHDLGLIGAVLSTLYCGMPLVLMSPLRFLLRPERWLQALHDHKGTMSAAPNFAYELCVRKVSDEVRAGLDLSAWRLTMNGAEPVNPGTLDRFEAAFADRGYRPEIMAPVYGLAESSVGLTAPRGDIRPTVDRVRRDVFARDGRAEPAGEGEDALEVVGCGRPLVGHELRVVDEAGRELPERREGRIHFRGPSSTAGYFENPAATAALLVGDGWLDSGDLGYLAGGEIFVTGRRKDVIIRGGRNIYPHELEEAVGEIPGVRKGCVAVFAARDEAGGTERVVVLAETREPRGPAREAIRGRILEVSASVLGSPADDVVVTGTGTVLKTSSGKLRRAACRTRYEAGTLDARPVAVWWQFVRLALDGAASKLRGGLREAAAWAWAAWFGGLFAAGVGAVILAAALLPGRRSRGHVGSRVARLVFWLAGVPVRVEGGENLPPPGPVLYVSNHTSLLDSLLLMAVLPPGTAFVSKREMGDIPVIGWAMRRFGAVFVERHAAARHDDAEARLRGVVEGGTSVVIYPEGTCLRMPGLLRFHMGAFVVAARAGVPLVPVVVGGVRDLLRPDTSFPRRSSLRVWVGQPIGPDGVGWDTAVRLRDRVREIILARCGEPDLEHEDVRRFF